MLGKRNAVPHIIGTLFRFVKEGDISTPDGGTDGADQAVPVDRPVRADARRNLDALLTAAMAVFAESGVDAPVREIAERAGVGVGTVYRHFPQRSDLIVAVLKGQFDACADDAAKLAAEFAPDEALDRWIGRYVELMSTKRGFAAALHSGDPAYHGLRDYFMQRMEPAMRGLLERAAETGAIRGGVNAWDFLQAVATLSHGRDGEQAESARGMVRLLVDGLRYNSR